MRHYVLTRSAYGPSWSLEANRRRLAMTAGVTARSLASQEGRGWEWVVLLHPADPLLAERRAVFQGAAPRAAFIYMSEAADGTPQSVAWEAYRAGWSEAIGERDEAVAMTRLDDDDALAPWALASVASAASRARARAVLVLPTGVRVWQGCFTRVHHATNAMQTLVTPAGDSLTVYGYKHREARKVAPLLDIDSRPAWVWSRHPDTISGWRFTDRPLTRGVKAMFDVDWSLFGEAAKQQPPPEGRGRFFR